jgi:hypothetical protein
LDSPDEVVFKGGTSLSKAYQLIDRFSEDVDLLVTPHSDFAAEVNRILDRIEHSSSHALGGATASVRSFEPGVMRNVRFKPPYRTPKGGGVSTDVLVEAGRRGGPRPTERRPVRPWLADMIPQLAGDEDFAPVEVTVLHPARTLVEKLFVVRQFGDRLASNPEEKLGSRQARHFYDIWRLLGPGSPAVAHLSENAVVEDIVRDSEKITAQYFYPQLAPLHGSFADAKVFSDRRLDARIADALTQSCKDLCHSDTAIPTWPDVVEAVLAQRELLAVS